MGRMGQPTKLNAERKEKVIEYLLTGVSIEVAARAAGIEPQTHYNWMNRGRPRTDDDPPHDESDAIYVDYFEAVIRARAEREAFLAGQVVRQAVTDWRAAAWMLERGIPERWARRTEVTGVGGQPVELRAVPQQPVDEANVRAMQAVFDRTIVGREEVIDLVELPSPNGNGNGQHHADTT